MGSNCNKPAPAETVVLHGVDAGLEEGQLRAVALEQRRQPVGQDAQVVIILGGVGEAHVVGAGRACLPRVVVLACGAAAS